MSHTSPSGLNMFSVGRVANQKGDKIKTEIQTSSDKQEAFIQLQQLQQQQMQQQSSQHQHSGSSRVLSSASSAHNTDADDSDSDAKKHQKDRRRERHTKAEQMRRDQIKNGYDELVTLVPTLNGMLMDGETSATADLITVKPSKAAILQRSIDYVLWLEKESKRQEEEVEMIRREVTGLKIMKEHYQQMLIEAKQAEDRVIQSQRTTVAVQEAKFTIFKDLMESLFASFDSLVGVTSFVELSSGVIRWLEEHCAPQSMHHRLSTILQRLFTSHENGRESEETLETVSGYGL